jgi:hypothetical protein
MKLSAQCSGVRCFPAARLALRSAASTPSAASTSADVKLPARNRRSSSCQSHGESIVVLRLTSRAGVVIDAFACRLPATGAVTAIRLRVANIPPTAIHGSSISITPTIIRFGSRRHVPKLTAPGSARLSPHSGQLPTPACDMNCMLRRSYPHFPHRGEANTGLPRTPSVSKTSPTTLTATTMTGMMARNVLTTCGSCPP